METPNVIIVLGVVVGLGIIGKFTLGDDPAEQTAQPAPPAPTQSLDGMMGGGKGGATGTNLAGVKSAIAAAKGRAILKADQDISQKPATFAELQPFLSIQGNTPASEDELLKRAGCVKIDFGTFGGEATFVPRRQ